jgi:hypothetical protein
MRNCDVAMRNTASELEGQKLGGRSIIREYDNIKRLLNKQRVDILISTKPLKAQNR